MSNIITVKDMCLWYGDHQALKNINIEIPQKSIKKAPHTPKSGECGAFDCKDGSF